MTRFLKWFTRVTEFIAAMALAVIFLTFLIQIFTRYAAQIAWLVPIPAISDWMLTLQPIGWTINLISLLWVWIIFFGCAFFVREKDHVAFDVLYLAMPRRGRQVLAILTALILIGTMIYSFAPTWDAIMVSRLTVMKKIQTLSVPFTGDKIPVRWLFASYVLLMVAIIIRYLWRIYMTIRYDPPGVELEEISSDEHAVSGLNHEH